MPTWTMDEHVARAFPGLPLAVLMLTHGDGSLRLSLSGR